MILYNWEKIVKASRGNAFDIVTILRIITYKLKPKNYHDLTFKFYEKNFGGHSFLLNPEELLEKGRTYSDREVAEYAGVASFRNYYRYNKDKDTTLDFILCKVSKETINKNRLLRIEDDKIHFLYEETGEKRWL
jgi:hypothetical protein